MIRITKVGRQHASTRGTDRQSGHADSIASKTVISAGGITASPLGKILASRAKAQFDKGGRVMVKPDLTIDLDRSPRAALSKSRGN